MEAPLPTLDAVMDVVLPSLGSRSRANARAVCATWDTALRTLPSPIADGQSVPVPHGDRVHLVKWSPDGETVAFTFEGGSASVRLFRMGKAARDDHPPTEATETLLPSLNPANPRAVVMDIGFSSDVTTLFVVYYEGFEGRDVFVRVQSLTNPSAPAEDHATFPNIGQEDEPPGMRLAPRPTAQCFRLAQGCMMFEDDEEIHDGLQNSEVNVWEKRGLAAAWQLVHTFPIRANMLDVWFSPDGTHLAVSATRFRNNMHHTERLSVYALATGTRLSTIRHKHGILHLAFSEGNNLVTTLDRRARALEHNIISGACLRLWAGADCFAQWDRGLSGGVAIVFRDGRVALDGVFQTPVIEGPLLPVRKAALSPDGRALVVCGGGVVRVRVRILS